MARFEQRVAQNVTGDFFVDDTCIDCATCRELAPETFADAHGQSYVHHQPVTPRDLLRATMAQVACPTASIGGRKGNDVTRAAAQFPTRITDDVLFCGFTSSSSYGAWSYLVVRPGGNILVDCPRFNRGLIERMEQLGGVSLMFLTHQDDVADHVRYAAHFHCPRVIHASDARGMNAERTLTGANDIALADDLLVIPTPGHTRGHCALLYRNTYLFSGDHLWWDADERRLGASRSVCWYSWPEQLRSIAKLSSYRFRWVLPGHGTITEMPTEDDMRHAVQACATRLSA